MNQKERMLNGLPYKAWLDGLEEEREICKQFVYELNFLPPKERGRIPELLKKLLGKRNKRAFSIRIGCERGRKDKPFVLYTTKEGGELYGAIFF